MEGKQARNRTVSPRYCVGHFSSIRGGQVAESSAANARIRAHRESESERECAKQKNQYQTETQQAKQIDQDHPRTSSRCWVEFMLYWNLCVLYVLLRLLLIHLIESSHTNRMEAGSTSKELNRMFPIHVVLRPPTTNRVIRTGHWYGSHRRIDAC